MLTNHGSLRNLQFFMVFLMFIKIAYPKYGLSIRCVKKCDYAAVISFNRYYLPASANVILSSMI